MGALPIAVIDSVADREFGDLPIASIPLNGSSSLPSDGASSIAAWNWVLHSKPPTSAAILGSSTTATPTLLNVDVPGSYLITLKVTDNLGRESFSGIEPVQSTTPPYGFSFPPASSMLSVRVRTEGGLVKVAYGERAWLEKGLWEIVDKLDQHTAVIDQVAATTGSGQIYADDIYEKTLNHGIDIHHRVRVDELRNRVGSLVIETTGPSNDIEITSSNEMLLSSAGKTEIASPSVTISASVGDLKLEATGGSLLGHCSYAMIDSTGDVEIVSANSSIKANSGGVTVNSTAGLSASLGGSAQISSVGALSLDTSGSDGDVIIETFGSDGDITIRTNGSTASVSIAATNNDVTITASGSDGDITLSATDDITLTTNGTNGDISLSATGTDGDIILTASGLTGNINLSAGSDIGITTTGGSKSVTLTASGTGGTVVLAPLLHTTSERPVFAPGLIQSSTTDEKHTDQFSGNVFINPPVFSRYTDGDELTADIVLSVYDSKAAPVEVRVKRNSTVLATFEMPTPLSSGWRVVRIKCSTRFGPDQISSNFVEYYYSGVMSTGGSSLSDTRGVAYHVLNDSPRPSSITFNVQLVDAVDELRAQMTCTLAKQHTQDVL